MNVGDKTQWVDIGTFLKSRYLNDSWYFPCYPSNNIDTNQW